MSCTFFHSSCRFHNYRLHSCTFTSCHTFSMTFKSGLCAGLIIICMPTVFPDRSSTSPGPVCKFQTGSNCGLLIKEFFSSFFRSIKTFCCCWITILHVYAVILHFHASKNLCFDCIAIVHVSGIYCKLHPTLTFTLFFGQQLFILTIIKLIKLDIL